MAEKRNGVMPPVAAQANTGNAWVVNTATGQLRLCQPPAQKNGSPVCWAWTQ